MIKKLLPTFWLHSEHLLECICCLVGLCLHFKPDLANFREQHREVDGTRNTAPRNGNETGVVVGTDGGGLVLFGALQWRSILLEQFKAGTWFQCDCDLKLCAQRGRE